MKLSECMTSSQTHQSTPPTTPLPPPLLFVPTDGSCTVVVVGGWLETFDWDAIRETRYANQGMWRHYIYVQFLSENVYIYQLFHSLDFLFQDASNENEVEQIIRTNPILKYSKLALKAPLLALPYGHSQSSRKYRPTLYRSTWCLEIMDVLLVNLKYSGPCYYAHVRIFDWFRKARTFLSAWFLLVWLFIGLFVYF